MKKAFLAAAVLAVSLSSAFAADLPSRKAPPAPAPVATVTAPAKTGFFVGVHGGYDVNGKDAVLGASAGYDFGVVRLEGVYDRYNTNPVSNAFTGNVLLQQHFGRLTPYVLAGAGVALNKDFDLDSRVAIYNVGAGARYAITAGLDADLRVKYVAPIETNKNGAVVGTIGLSHQF